MVVVSRVGSLEIIKPNLRDYKLKVLIYGAPGVGKTTLAASANDVDGMKPALFVSIEAGTLSLAGMANMPSIVNLETFLQIREVFAFLKRADNPFKTVVIDSISELQLLNIENVVRDRSKGKAADSEIYLSDYRDSTRQMVTVIRAFRDLPMHVIFTAAEAVTQDDTQQETLFPALTAKLRSSVVVYMDILGYLSVARPTTPVNPTEKPKLIRRLFTQPYGKIQAKDRTPGGRLGVYVDQPTMQSIYQLVYRSQKGN